METEIALMAHRKLPVWAVVKRSYGYVWERRGVLAIPLLAVFVVLIAANYLVYRQMPANPMQLTATDSLTIYLIGLAAGIFSMSFIVGIHRTVLLQEMRPGLGFLRWDSNFLRYLGTWLLLGLIGLLLLIILVLVLGVAAAISGAAQQAKPLVAIATIVVFVFGALFFLRLMLALPAAAVGAKDRLSLSWQATRGNWMRLLAIVILTFLPFIVVSIAIEIPTIIETASSVRDHAPMTPPNPGIVVQIIQTAIRAIDIAVLTVMLSLCYDVLVRGGGPAGTESQTMG